MRPPLRSSRAALALIAAAYAVLIFAGASSVPLLDPDESRFARTSVEMLRAGDPVVPRFEDQPRLVKPPLAHWIQMSLFRVAGPREWAARLHAGLSTLGSILLVAWIARRRFGEEAGPWAAAVLATMPLVLVPAKVGTLDALLAVHVLAVVALDLAGREGRDGSRALVTGALLGLAFLAKGPVGVVLPLLILLAGRTASGQEVAPSLAVAVRVAAGWCVVVLPWGLVFLRRVGGAAALATIRDEVLERYFVGTLHVEPPWYYAEVVAAGFLPWLAPLALALARVWRLRRDPASRTARYCAAGLLAGIAFFSLGQTKLPSYILPLAPLAAILLTWELGRELQSPDGALGPRLLAGTAAATAALLALAAAFQLDGALRAAAFAAAALHAVAAVVAAGGALAGRPRRAWLAVASATGVSLFVVALVLFPAIGRERSAAALVEAVPELRQHRPLVTVEIRVPSLTFYLDRVPEVLTMEDLPERLDREDGALYVLADVDLPHVPAGARRRLRQLGHHAKLTVWTGTFSDAR